MAAVVLFKRSGQYLATYQTAYDFDVINAWYVINITTACFCFIFMNVAHLQVKNADTEQKTKCTTCKLCTQWLDLKTLWESGMDMMPLHIQWTWVQFEELLQ